MGLEYYIFLCSRDIFLVVFLTSSIILADSVRSPASLSFHFISCCTSMSNLFSFFILDILPDIVSYETYGFAFCVASPSITTDNGVIELN